MVGRGAGALLVTLVDRRSGFLAGGRAASHTKADATSAQVAALAGQPCEAITVDRGKEFAGHAEVAAALGRTCISRCPTTSGSGGPTRTPMAWCASTSPRAPTSRASETTRSPRCTMPSNAGRASDSGSGRPGGPLLRCAALALTIQESFLSEHQ